MQSVYSWMGTDIHLVLEDDFANDYNRAQEAFFTAQIIHKTATGSAWNGRGPLQMNWTEKEFQAFDKVGKFINLLIDMNGGSLNLTEEQMTSDFLVKL